VRSRSAQGGGDPTTSIARIPRSHASFAQVRGYISPVTAARRPAEPAPLQVTRSRGRGRRVWGVVEGGSGESRARGSGAGGGGIGDRGCGIGVVGSGIGVARLDGEAGLGCRGWSRWSGSWRGVGRGLWKPAVAFQLPRLPSRPGLSPPAGVQLAWHPSSGAARARRPAQVQRSARPGPAGVTPGQRRPRPSLVRTWIRRTRPWPHSAPRRSRSLPWR
jgi:hypothetical protein